jgi:hypothetical protein
MSLTENPTAMNSFNVSAQITSTQTPTVDDPGTVCTVQVIPLGDVIIVPLLPELSVPEAQSKVRVWDQVKAFHFCPPEGSVWTVHVNPSGDVAREDWNMRQKRDKPEAHSTSSAALTDGSIAEDNADQERPLEEVDEYSFPALSNTNIQNNARSGDQVTRSVL